MSKTRIRRAVTGLIVVLGLLGAGRATHLGPRLRLGYQANGILAGATRVETFRVMSPVEALEPPEVAVKAGSQKPRAFSPTAPQVDGCYITATAKEQGPILAQEIAQVLFDEGTYTNDTLGCITEPGVVFRLWKGSQSLDVVLCFHCGEMYTVTYDANGRKSPGVYTLMAGNSRNDFARLAKQAFPDDKEIQAL